MQNLRKRQREAGSFWVWDFPSAEVQGSKRTCVQQPGRGEPWTFPKHLTGPRQCALWLGSLSKICRG